MCKWTPVHWYNPIRSGRYLVTRTPWTEFTAFVRFANWDNDKKEWDTTHVTAWIEQPKPFSVSDIGKDD